MLSDSIVQEELETLQQQVEALQSAQDAAGESAAAEVTALKKEVEELTAANGVLDQENDRIEGGKMEAEQALENALQEVESIAAQRDVAQTKEKEFQDSVEALRGEKQALLADVQLLEAQVEELQSTSTEV